VVCVYVLDDETPKHRKMGGASRWWLHHSLASLSRSLEARGSRLILRRGRCEEELAAVAAAVGAGRVHCIRHYEPWWRNAERAVAQKLDLVCHDGNYLMPAGAVVTGSGQPYKIYTPFSRALLDAFHPSAPLPVPDLPAPDAWPRSDRLEGWQLLPTKPDWSTGFAEAWEVGEEAAADRLDWWDGKVSAYAIGRNLPSRDLSSRLSPHLHFGEISPLQVWHAVEQRRGEGADVFRKELIWRDYAQTVICQFPDYGQKSYRGEFEHLEWRDPDTDEAARADFAAWQQGRTGYPIVDAAMRQINRTGYMHNRLRMIAASFLVKDLLVDWRLGEKYFADHLNDFDLAANNGGWQWAASTGCDAQPYFRIFNPVTQSEKFDADGAFIRKYLPELARCETRHIHAPWTMTPSQQQAAGVIIGRDYPAPVVDHAAARARALELFKAVRP